MYTLLFTTSIFCLKMSNSVYYCNKIALGIASFFYPFDSAIAQFRSNEKEANEKI